MITKEEIKKISNKGKLLKGWQDINDLLQEFQNPIKIGDLDGIEIKDGKDAKPEEVAEVLKNDPEFIESVKGKDGKDYVFTEADKKEIAQYVPVVEKVIERTEVIKEQPIVKTEVTEVQVLDEKKLEANLPKYGEKFRDALELLQGKERLNVKAIDGIEELIEELREKIKNIPNKTVYYGRNSSTQSSGGNTIATEDLTSQCNGSTKTFTVPEHSSVIQLVGSQFPHIYRPTVDFTVSGTTLTLTSAVGAPETGQTLLFTYAS